MCVLQLHTHSKITLVRSEKNSTCHSFRAAKLRNIFLIKSQDNLHWKGSLEVICFNPSLKVESICIKLLRALKSYVSLVGVAIRVNICKAEIKEGAWLENKFVSMQPYVAEVSGKLSPAHCRTRNAK